MSKWLNLTGMLAGMVGIFFGFFYLGTDSELALAIVAATTVGAVGVLAFVRHFVFHKSDAKRMGWESERPEWAYEVGFANLAFAVIALVSVFACLGVKAQAVGVLGYAVYLMQAAILHAHGYIKSETKSAAKLWRSVVGTASFAAIMLFFSIYALAGGIVVDGDKGDPAQSAAGPSAATNIVQATPVEHVTVGDISVGYRVIGPLAEDQEADDETPLLLIVGSSSTMDMWPPALVSALAADRKVIVFDNRGMGETSNPKSTYALDQLADDTAGLITALGYGPVDVMGWSMGGDVAIDLALRHPQAIRRLISYAGSAGGPSAVGPSQEVIAVLTDTSGDPQQREMKLLELLFPESYRTAHPDYMSTFPMPVEKADPAQIGLQNQAIGAWEGAPGGAKGINCPVLFVTGAEDQLTPPLNAVAMAAQVPGSWLMQFAGAGHGLMYQEPRNLAGAVLLFLGDTSDR